MTSTVLLALAPDRRDALVALRDALRAAERGRRERRRLERDLRPREAVLAVDLRLTDVRGDEA